MRRELPTFFKDAFHGLLWIEKLLHLRFNAFIDLDERRPPLSESFVPTRRPGTFETFAGQFLRRVEAELAADGDFDRCVVELVGRIEIIHFPALPELRVCVGSQS